MSAGRWSSVPAREYKEDRDMKALWFCEMCRKSLEIWVVLWDVEDGEREAVEIREREVLRMKGNSVRWFEGLDLETYTFCMMIGAYSRIEGLDFLGLLILVG